MGRCITWIAVCAVLALALTAGSVSADPTRDVPLRHWAYDVVQKLVVNQQRVLSMTDDVATLLLILDHVSIHRSFAMDHVILCIDYFTMKESDA